MPQPLGPGGAGAGHWCWRWTMAPNALRWAGYALGWGSGRCHGMSALNPGKTVHTIIGVTGWGGIGSGKGGVSLEHVQP